MRLVARVSGRVQMMAGYRAKVADLARSFGLTGFVQDFSEKDSKDLRCIRP